MSVDVDYNMRFENETVRCGKQSEPDLSYMVEIIGCLAPS